jgi:PilZ domain
MPSEPPRDRRRSTRIRLKVEIEAKGVAEPLTCEGKTEVVNLHGAFISTAVALRVGMTVDIRVVLTGKCARATVVYVDREQPRFCGISFERSQNIWGILLPPDDWTEDDWEGVPE